MRDNFQKGEWYLEVLSLWCMLVIYLSLVQGRALAGGVAARDNQQGQQMMQQQMMQEQMRQEQMVQQHRALREEQAKTRALSADQLGVQSEADFDDVIQDLLNTSRAWTLMVDADAKEAVVAYFLKDFRGKGIAVKKPAWYYVSLIDSMAQGSPEMLDQPLDRVLQVVAIIEYDFENGQDKDLLAYQILGSKQAVIQNRQRLGLP